MLPLTLTHPGWDPVAFQIGPLAIHWYALMYLLGFAIAYGLLRVRLHHPPFNRIDKPKRWTPEDLENILVASIVGVMVGGRLGYCFFYQPGYYLTHPIDIIKIWDGGMSFHGGAIGVAVALLVFARRTRRPFLEVTDLLLPAVPTGLAAGRLGNFINGELWGRPTDVPWAMIFPNHDMTPRHPSQLYQLALEGLLLFALLWLFARRERARGEVSAAFLVGYGAFRFIAEFFREPDDFLGLLSLNLSMGQWLCIPMILAGIGMWIWARRADVHAPPSSADEPDAKNGDAEADHDGDETADTEDEVATDTEEAAADADEAAAGAEEETAAEDGTTAKRAD